MSCQPFCPCHPHVGLSSHVMPTRACATAGIYGCGHLFPPFLLDKKSKIRRSEASQWAKESRPTSSVPTHEADASPPCRPWPAHPTQSGFGVPTHGIRAENSTPTDNASPFTVIAGPSFRERGTRSPKVGRGSHRLPPQRLSSLRDSVFNCRIFSMWCFIPLPSLTRFASSNRGFPDLIRNLLKSAGVHPATLSISRPSTSRTLLFLPQCVFR